MSTISLSLPSDGQTIDASDVNTPFNTISAVINGNLDDTNIVSGANINGSKLLANSIPGSKLDTTLAGGWVTDTTNLPAPNTVTALGNRSYSLVFNTTDITDTVSAGMRLRTTRTVAAPTQCTSLNGTTQYYAKTSPAGMTFTDDFVVSAWVKVSSYAQGSIASRYNGTSGWSMNVEANGQITLTGFNAASGNFSQVISYQSVPLNKWVHVAAQLDMSTFTATTTTSYVMIDGLDVPSAVTRGGTNPTALVQAGNLEIGSQNGGSKFFPGKLAQVAIYNAKVTQATILASMHQTLSGSETSLISAYSFNNTINDLNANANNLTANGSAVATNADSPFGGQADGTISSTLDYGIITKTAFSTNTTLTVQVPEGCTIPTSGGVSAVSYSTQKVPYGFPAQRGKWQVGLTVIGSVTTSGTVTNTIYNPGGLNITVPIGEWIGTFAPNCTVTPNASTLDLSTALSTSSSVALSGDFSARTTIQQGAVSNAHVVNTVRLAPISAAAATPYYLLIRSGAPFTQMQFRGDLAAGTLFEQTNVILDNAYL